MLYRTTAQDLAGSRSVEEALRQQLIEALARAAGQGRGKASGQGKDSGEMQALRDTVAALESEIAERKKKMEALEGKLSDLEKEYMVLYQQQQQAKEINMYSSTGVQRGGLFSSYR